MSLIPNVDKVLVDYLDRMYPDVSPELNMSEREIFFRRGAVDVVRTLRRIYAEQNETFEGFRYD